PRVQSIVDATRRLDRMISDLLDVSRLGAGRLAIERVYVDVAALLQRVVEQFARDGEHTIELEVKEDLTAVHADPERLEQVLANLISNALKYREPDTPILVTASERSGEIEIAVTNTGAGISAEEVPALFTRFYRAGSATSSGVPGLGLGLYIAKELVHAHGGRVWAESVPGEETTFRFTLPMGSV
ncbi:MAG TPA: ATP-binding protein, partial [Nitrospirales bacterium]